MDFSQRLTTAPQGLRRVDQALQAAGFGELGGGDLQDDAAVEAVVAQERQEVSPRDRPVDERLVVFAAENIMAMDVADVRQQGLRRVERPAVPARVPVRVSEVPARTDAASLSHLQQFVVRIADTLSGFARVWTDLQLDCDTNVRRILPAPLRRPT